MPTKIPKKTLKGVMKKMVKDSATMQKLAAKSSKDKSEAGQRMARGAQHFADREMKQANRNFDKSLKKTLKKKKKK